MRAASASDNALEREPHSFYGILRHLAAKAQKRAMSAPWAIVCGVDDVDLLFPTQVIEPIFRQLLETISAALPQGGTVTLSSSRLASSSIALRLTIESTERGQNGWSESTVENAERIIEQGVTKSRAILHELAGELRVERPDADRLTFIMILPVPEKPAAKKTHLRILVVDDEDSVRAVMVDMADLLGHEADGVAGGVEALNLLERRNYDAVISDVGMPEMDGAELVSRIRQKWVDLPIILVSGWGLEECEEIATERRGVWVLEKPVQIPLLEKTLNEIALQTLKS
jgi:CheY-like chemotaxis protein